MTRQCEEKRKEDTRIIKRQLREKEEKVRKKLQEADELRMAELEVKRERQRLVQEDAKKRLEFKKRNINFKKLQVLDKHQRIDSLCS